MAIKPFWDESYKRPGTLDTFGGGKPSPEVVAIAPKLPAHAAVLDLGCGEGRNALYLASLGFRTYASDISESGISKLRTNARQLNLPITADICDMRDYVFPLDFGLIVCQGCLHLIPREAWQQILQRMQRHTTSGGYHVVGVFTDTVPEPEDQRGLMVGLFKEGELQQHYRDWQILGSDNRVFEHQHPGGIHHQHAANSLTARKA
jgi:tellurite methyltransferase